MQGTFRASVLDLSRPKRNELRQIALAHVATRACVGHTRIIRAVVERGCGRLIPVRCCLAVPAISQFSDAVALRMRLVRGPGISCEREDQRLAVTHCHRADFADATCRAAWDDLMDGCSAGRRGVCVADAPWSDRKNSEGEFIPAAPVAFRV